MKPEGKIGSPGTAWTPQVRIKICGLTRTEDVRLAVTLGADYLGFIFASSPRQVAAEAVQAILSSLEQEQSGKLTGVERVGVFVNADRYLIEETARRANLTVLQLHGDEDPEFCSRFELPVIKALRIRDREIFDRIDSYPTPYILLEPYVPGKHGGTGIQANWQLAAELVQSFPAKRFFLAGGLEPKNVQAAVSTVLPFAVDASSALESAPGIKDRHKMKAFMEAVRKR